MKIKNPLNKTSQKAQSKSSRKIDIFEKKDNWLCCHSKPGGSKILKDLSQCLHIQVNVWKNGRVVQIFGSSHANLKTIDVKFYSDDSCSLKKCGRWFLKNENRNDAKKCLLQLMAEETKSSPTFLKTLIQNCSPLTSAKTNIRLTCQIQNPSTAKEMLHALQEQCIHGDDLKSSFDLAHPRSHVSCRCRREPSSVRNNNKKVIRTKRKSKQHPWFFNIQLAFSSNQKDRKKFCHTRVIRY